MLVWTVREETNPPLALPASVMFCPSRRSPSAWKARDLSPSRCCVEARPGPSVRTFCQGCHTPAASIRTHLALSTPTYSCRVYPQPASLTVTQPLVALGALMPDIE